MIGRLSGDAAAARSGEIAGILAGAFAAPDQRWTPDSVAATLRVSGTVAFLAPGACALLRLAADEAEILTLAVRPEARRQRLAAALVQACLSEATAARAARLHLEVGAGNAAARALYGRAGFVETGRRSGYYHSAAGREDAVLMARDLAPAVPAAPAP